ncbi:MAG: hypothetical protein DCC75_08420 [Proteobacteria bacterium]|nr:MAG: hypothetical protein DCC75_08420 [Pseudomonadota bacterium]
MRVLTILAAIALSLWAGGLEAETLDLLKRSWISTGADNSLVRNPALFKFRGTFVRTNSEETNIHSHFKAGGFRSLRNYIYSGQMRLADENGGIGVTFHSQYRRADRYYRLRSFPGNPQFHIAPHPDGIQLITAGDSDSEVVPIPGRWYNFKVMVRTTSARTRIRAKVWRAGTSQPGWQINCSDESDIRIKRGKLGIWSMAAGQKKWRRLEVN